MSESVLDLSNQALQSIVPISGVNPKIVIYDKNAISKIENLENYTQLHQVSKCKFYQI